MRILLLLILLIGGAGAAVFYTKEPVRDKVRGYMIDDADRERYEAYLRGKAIFKANWPGSADAQFKAWGDDGSEMAGPLEAEGVTGNVWIARGRMTVNKDGSKVEEQWCSAFDRDSGASRGLATDQKAEEYLRKVDSGELRKHTQTATTSGPAAPSLPGASTPKPGSNGSWMWGKDGRGALDQPPKRSGS